jgi:hypothetical protein
MAGIGIAAAIGFVLALSFVSNNNNNAVIDTGNENPNLAQERSSSEPSSLLIQHKAEESQGTAAEKRMMEADENNNNASLMMQQGTSSSLAPTLVSITASDGITGNAIGDVVPEMQFKVHKPVFIKSNFVNTNDVPLPSHLIAMGISTKNESSSTATTFANQSQLYQQATTFHGDISANGSVELELYWNPASTGEYALFLFSMTPENLASNEPIRPIESIPIRVVQENTS